MATGLGRGPVKTTGAKRRVEKKLRPLKRTLHVPSAGKMTIINTTMRTINLTQNGKYHTYPAIIPRAART
jgi:hypothetical protein